MTSTAGSLAGAEHLRALSRAVRRSGGIVYTPEPLVEFVLDMALQDRSELLDGRVLDPACGSGAFLTALLRRLAARLSAQGHDLASPEGHAALVEAAQERIRGVDIDDRAVGLARQALRDEVQRLSPGPVPSDFMEREVRPGDFLDPRTSHDGPPGLIVGNPPYVPVDRLDGETKERLRRDFATATGRLDLYTVFMEGASRLVALNGRWAMITPDKFLTSQSARALREHLAHHGTVRTLARFDSHRVFADAATIPCVTVWERRPHHGHVRVLRLVHGPLQTISVLAEELVERSRFRGTTWRTESRAQTSLHDRIAADHPRLRDVCARISAGPATGHNPAFLLAADAAASLENELVHRTVGGRDVHANRILDRGLRLFLPYTWDGAAPGSLIDLEDYPRAASWLARHRDALERRHCVRVWGKQWWDVHDPVREPLHLVPKLVVPDLARTNRFAADHAGVFVPQHSLYYAVPHEENDPRVLAALLNSQAVQHLVTATAPLVKDGFRRYRRQFLLDLPVPEVGEAASARIVDMLARGDEEGVARVADEIYGIEPEELRVADRPA